MSNKLLARRTTISCVRSTIRRVIAVRERVVVRIAVLVLQPTIAHGRTSHNIVIKTARHRDDRDQCAVKVINVLHVLATLTASANASLSCCVCCLYVLLWWYVSSALLGHCFRSVDC